MTLRLLSVFLILTLSLPAFSQPENCHEIFSTISTHSNHESAEFIRVKNLIDAAPTELEAELPPVYRDTKLLNEIRNLRGAEKAQAFRLYARQVLPKDQKYKNLLPVLTSYVLATAVGVTAFAQAHGHPMTQLEMLAAVPPTLFAADLVSGFVHKSLDSWASEKGALGGAVRAFRMHHENPDGMSDNTYLENTGDTAKFLAPILGAVAAAPMAGVHVDPVVGSSSLVFLLTLINSQVFHAQAHSNNPNLFFKVLQAARLSLRKSDHSQHHRPPFENDFAALNGWSNPATRRLWPKLDLILWRLNKKLQGQWVQDPRSMPDEVVEEIKKGLVEIPEELLIYTQAYEKRLPKDPEFRKIILETRETWRTTFVKTRRERYVELSSVDAELADRLWETEQRENPWIFGTAPEPLPH